MWTHFHDMHSGGSRKLAWGHIFIEATTEHAAIALFKDKFGRDPSNVTCECCGEDYAIDSNDDLAQVTGYERRCEFENSKYVERAMSESSRSYVTLDAYMADGEAFFVPMLSN